MNSQRLLRQFLPVLSLLAALAGGFAAPAAAAAAPSACELDRPVRFAGLDWDSNRLLTEIVRQLFEEDFGCVTQSEEGATLAQFDDLADGDFDVMMEVWETNFRHRWRAALRRGAVLDLGASVEGAVQGWFVPRYLVDGDPDRDIAPRAPDLRHVDDLPRYAKLFRDPENPSRGRFYNCPLGWSCEIINSNKLRAYGLRGGFTNYRPRNGEKLLDSLLRHYARGEPFVTYYWGPSWLLGARELIRLDEPAYDEAHWNGLLTARARDPRGCAYPRDAVRLGVNARFASEAPRLVALLRAFSLSRADLDALLAQMRGLGIGHRLAARRFLGEHPELREQWLAAAAATTR